MCSPDALCASAAKYSRHSAPEITSTTRVSWIGLPVSRVSSCRELVVACAQDLGRAAQDAGALGTRERGPGWLRRARGRDRGLDLGRSGHGKRGQPFAGRGVRCHEKFVSHAQFCETSAGCEETRTCATNQARRGGPPAWAWRSSRPSCACPLSRRPRPSRNPAGRCASRTSAGPTSRRPRDSRATSCASSGTSPGSPCCRCR